ncbi:MBL fold metallo-hydrolase [Paracoccus sp. S1E-3]|uniref:MBL fold metallo-hydrolase n=1 Tax=Paracoccus sp. S1E-3 TaxID=2756130 RepID=UPI0015EF220C|nr:MBL fold metallo-hydrolase [Paracoccus sp. S1E-3]MBA4491121.1 MBL fold metallo-hydrolase [Paracoccus sp. S1E-3]
MFHLLVAACLTSDPSVCSDRLLPAADAASRAECEARAEAALRDWGARDGLTANSPRCVETGALPALRLDEIVPGVLVHQGVVAMASAENRGRIANIGVVIGPTITVIDPGGSRAEAEALYAAIRLRSAAPIGAVILTHPHPDHSFGAAFFAEVGAEVIAADGYESYLLPRRETWLGSYIDGIGLAEMLGSAFAPPTSTQAPEGFDLLKAPQAHTSADLMAVHKPTSTVFAGDLIFRELTPVVDGSLTGWLDWLATTRAPASGMIVPGHGPVATTWNEAVTPMRTYLQTLKDTTLAEIAAGTALSEAVPRIVKAMQPLAPGWADFDATTARNAASAYAELEWQ